MSIKIELRNGQLVGVDENGNVVPVEMGSLDVNQLTISQLEAAAYLSGSSSQTVSNVTSTKVVIDTIGTEDSEIYTVDLPNNNISVDVDGTYLIKGKIEWATDSGWSTGDRASVNIQINGSGVEVNTDRKISTKKQPVRSFAIQDLSANDTIDLNAYQDSGSDKVINGGQGRTRIMVARLG